MALPIAWPVAAAPVFVLLMYRRLRHLTGRQPVKTRLLWTRILLLALVLAVLAASPLADDRSLLELLGVALLPGVALGVLGVRLTRIERAVDGDFYTPNRWIGLILIALLAGRALYRYVLRLSAPAASRRDAGAWLAGYHHHPWTLVLMGLVLGYYLTYNIGLLLAHRRHRASDGPFRRD